MKNEAKMGGQFLRWEKWSKIGGQEFSKWSKIGGQEFSGRSKNGSILGSNFCWVRKNGILDDNFEDDEFLW
jgi:hypothetical protein